MEKMQLEKRNETVEILVKVKGLTPEEFEKGIKSYKKEKRKLEEKIPKKGFFISKKKQEKIKKYRSRLKIYTQLVDLDQVIRELNGKVIKKIAYYNQGEKKNENWQIYHVRFKNKKVAKKFKDFFFELHPECQDEMDGNY